MTRRTLIQRLFLILGISPFGPREPWPARVAEAGPRPVRPLFDPTPESGTLSKAEMDDLVAFAEVLVGDGTLPLVERGYLVEHIEDRMRRSPGYLSLYRTTVRTLERLAGHRFASREIRERLEVIARHRLAVSDIWPGEDLGRFPVQIRALRKRAVPDLIGGYYASPAGWAVVGYEVFPGRCGDLTRYARPES